MHLRIDISLWEGNEMLAGYASTLPVTISLQAAWNHLDEGQKLMILNKAVEGLIQVMKEHPERDNGGCRVELRNTHF